MKLIVGLGNPGLKYENTRHNIGFKIIDAAANHFDVSLSKQKFNGIYFQNQKFILAKPLTFMNLSGDFVSKIIKYFKIKLDDVLIIYDDLALEPGKLLLKPQGSSNGHNGLQNIIDSLGTTQIARLKIGIGKPKYHQSTYVLDNFTSEELLLINPLKNKIVQVIDDFINFNLQVAMNKLHQ